MSPRHLRASHSTSFLLCIVLLTLLGIFGAGCSSERDRSGQVTEQPRPAVPIPPAPAVEPATAMDASPSADTLYSDAPGCNALVTRLADEMVPCLERVNPEYSKRLQAMLETFGENPRLLLDPVHRDEVLRRTEEDCRAYWRQIVNQLDSKAPEGQCRPELDD